MPPSSLLAFILMHEAWNCMPRLNVQALRKPLETDVGITVLRYIHGDHYANSCFLFEVSQASYIQEEDITPLFYQQCIWTRLPQSECKDSENPVINFHCWTKNQCLWSNI